MWAATAAVTVYCAKKVREDNDPSKIPLMGVAGAFVFAGQMLNFTIPVTGSSGHLGGGLLLALLLGPEAAFLVMASVLTVQALFFADGGLLALGANIINMGFFSAFIAFPVVYRRVVGDSRDRRRVIAGSVAGAVVGLLLGAMGVVLETRLSGVSALPFSAFLLLMMPIHLAIGIVEGVITAATALFVMQAQPELLVRTTARRPLGGVNLKPVLIGLAIAAVIAGGAVSSFASTHPDGLEWSIQAITGSPEIESANPVHRVLARIQGGTALMPDYGLKVSSESGAAGEDTAPATVDPGTSTAGVVGAGIVLALAAAIGFILKRRAGSNTPGAA